VEEPVGASPSVEAIQTWIVARVSHRTGVPSAEVDVRAPLTRHGLDSVALITLAADLEKWLGYRFRENPLNAASTIESLARFLAGEVAKNRT
jgi:acyl carrier protein